MSEERLLQVLLGPHVSEKSTNVGDAHNQVVFKVRTDATKSEIKQAVETLFKVTVTGVTVANVKGKRKRFGRMAGVRKGWKKAYVRVAQGGEIDFLSVS
ncbi:MAG: 50S ribosomal protein L23 [Pseudomonadota bacterium]|nr:50S ribosomal protein L23 [Pseudomonadota bacterium]